MATHWPRSVCGPVLCGVAATSALAELPRADRVGYLHYDLTTHDWVATARGERGGDVWRCSRSNGAFRPTRPDEVLLDWGDYAPAGGVGEFEIAYAANVPGPLDVEIVFFANEDGFNSVSRGVVAQFRLNGLPGAQSGITHAWVVSVSPGFGLGATDREAGGTLCSGYGLPDFGYSYRFATPLSAGDLIGPLVASPDPNLTPCAAPGAEDAYDVFLVDPNHPPGSQDTLIAGVNTRYDGSYWIGPSQFAQFYLALEPATPGTGCGAGGCETADFHPAGGDCVVDLNDLAVQLAHFGQAAGASRSDGDIHPSPGDGDVDLNDLALLLADYGVDCR